MRALLLAAGVGTRMGAGGEVAPKCLLEFAGRSLLRRHVEILAAEGIDELCVGVGYREDLVVAELSRLDASLPVRTVRNPEYRDGSIVTLWTLRHELERGGEVLLMDADVLYDARMIARLTGSRSPSCLLLDRDFEAGEEPVKVCVRDGRVVEFRKHVDPELRYDYVGESVGFFRLSESVAERLSRRAALYVDSGRQAECHEEALRDLVLDDPQAEFGIEDVTGLPWTEIDFPADVRLARDEVLPRLQEPGRETDAA